MREAYRGLVSVQDHVVHPDFLSRLSQRFRRRQSARAAHESPAAHQRADSDVERATGFATEPLGVLQQPEKLWFDTHGFSSRATVDMTDVARRFVKAQLRVESLDLVQRFLSRGPERNFAFTVENDLKAGRHGLTCDGDGFHGD